jgi:DNA-binding transcriptional regulator YdaS (Cro superfamily)
MPSYDDPKRPYIRRHIRGTYEKMLRAKGKERRHDALQTSKQKLQDLILVAGSQARLAQLCGVEPHVVNKWVRNGISRRGAVLASRSREFKDLVTPRDLRSDIGALQLTEVVGTRAYRDAVLRQDRFEESEEFEAKSPRAALRRLKGE